MYKFNIQIIILIAVWLFPQMAKSQNSEDSPFAISGLSEMRTGDYTNPIDAGVKWVRLTGEHGMVWDKVEIPGSDEQLGDPANYYWEDVDNIANEFIENGFNIFWTINSFNRFDQDAVMPTGMMPNDLVSYEKFVRAAAERYDGDGVDDAPGSPVINYWQIHNEVNLSFFWGETPELYAKLFKLSYDAIKEANPNATVALAGMSEPVALTFGINNYIDILNELHEIGGTFDIFDIHWYGFIGNYKVHPEPNDISLSEFMTVDLPAALTNFENIEVWSTENGTYSGTDVDLQSDTAPPQTERAQAAELLKRYLYSLAYGVKKVFWKNMEESANYSVISNRNDYFDNIGLVYNGCGIEDGVFTFNPDGVGDDLGVRVKKLGFYTFKLMVERLEGCNWDNIETIFDNDNNNYAYKFFNENSGMPIYVAWWDYFEDSAYEDGDRTLMTLTDITSNHVIITRVVPDYNRGIDVTDYDNAFTSDTMNVTNGKVSFYINDSPVFIEEYNSTFIDKVNSGDNSIKIYPNPTTGILNIESDNIQSIEIINCGGRVVKRLIVDNSKYVVDLSHLTKGVYLLRIFTDNEVSTGKIVLT